MLLTGLLNTLKRLAPSARHSRSPPGNPVPALPQPL